MATERTARNQRWEQEGGRRGDEADPKAGARRGGGLNEAAWSETSTQDPDFRPLTREEAQVLRTQNPPLSPWRVISVQALVGVVAALLAMLVTGRQVIGWSLLYGAAAVVVPGALMARGMTSKLSSMSPGASAVSFMLWEFVKIAVAVAMMVLAPRLVQPLSWPALLVGLVLCMKVYWVALLWRGSSKLN
jgi:ATP synthase protein I